MSDRFAERRIAAASVDWYTRTEPGCSPHSTNVWEGRCRVSAYGGRVAKLLRVGARGIASARLFERKVEATAPSGDERTAAR